MNLNRVIIIGRMATETETRATPSGQNVSNFRVATNRVWNDRNTGQKQEQAEFHSVVAWGGLADIAQKYLKKGQLVQIEGRLQTRSWDGQDGKKNYRTEIVAENLQLGPKSSGASQDNSYNPSSSKSTFSSDSRKQSKNVDDDIPVIDVDSPTAGVGDDSPSGGVSESSVDLKDIPF